MSYQALYRKFRPSGFDDVKGQDAIVATLKNQIVADRVGHAYLFTGTRGTGKTSIAKIFARSVNCENPKDGSPCGECAICKAIAAGSSMNVIEIDAASNNGVENIREIIDEVSYSPAQGRYKVYIIDEVHMLSLGAFNALLKTLEEPPAYVIFILATTEVHKIPITILSRCQRYDFKRIPIETITGRLQDLMEKEQISVEEKALRYIAKTADGSMRDALSMLDQCIAFHYGTTLTYDKVLEVLGAVDTDVFSRILRQILSGDVAGCIGTLDEIIVQGREVTQFVADLTWYLRNLLLVKTADTAQLENVVDMSSEHLARLADEAQMADVETIMRYIRVLAELSGRLRTTAQKRVMIEMTLIKLCRPQMECQMDALFDRIRVLEEKLEKGEFVVAQAPSQAQVPIKKFDMAELPKAIPEEIKDVIGRWSYILSEIPPSTRYWLKNVRLSVDNDGNLLIVVSDRTAYDALIQEERKEEVQMIIANAIEKRVPILFRSVGTQEEMDQVYPDLKSVINMDIEEE